MNDILQLLWNQAWQICQHRTTEFDDLLKERLQLLSQKLRLQRVPRIMVSDVLFDGLSGTGDQHFNRMCSAVTAGRQTGRSHTTRSETIRSSTETIITASG